MRNSVITGMLVLWGCTDKVSSPTPMGAEKPPLLPFPSAHLVVDGRISISPDIVPMSVDGTPLALDRVNGRAGFSVVQSAVVDFGVALDGDTLPGQGEALSDGTVQMWDLEAGLPIRCFAEVDASPELNGEAPVVIVRPLDLLPPGHRIAVAFTSAVQTADGDPLTAPDWYQDVMADRPGPDLSDWVTHYQTLSTDLADLGMDDLVFAFDFPVADGGTSVRAMVEQVSTPTSWSFEEVRDVDEGYILPEGTWRQLDGFFVGDNFLADENHLNLIDGVPQASGTIEARLFVHMPESVRDAPAGSVPVWLFGHGIFDNPEEYLGRMDDRSTVAELADEAGVIIVASEWRGLRAIDRLHALELASDFGRITEITDRLHQGIADVVGLSRLVLAGDLLSAPELEGKADPSQLMYYGISLGGIAGGVMLANNDAIDHGVLHVGGASWSTMLERSSQWIPFDWAMAQNVPSARDRQLLYALSQLYWDPVDPANHVAGLASKSVLWQEAVGDEQVANITTELIARAAGAQQLEPIVHEVPGLSTSPAPIMGRTLAQFDPEVALPPEENRPSPITMAHSNPRTWPGARQQVARFLDAVDPGVVEHFCGESPCSESNPGVD
jgi:hypothetical protein